MTIRTQEENIALFSGWPDTDLRVDEKGRKWAEVRIAALSPERVLTCKGCATLTIIAAVIFGLATANPALFFGSFLLFFAHGAITQKFANVLTPVTTVRLTAESFRVLRGRRWDVYDRRIKHSFALAEHDKALRERDKHQAESAFAQMNRRPYRPERIYTQSFHLIYGYYGQRHDIASIYDPKYANAACARLQALDAFMDTQLGIGESPASGEEDQCNEQASGPKAGDLP